MNRFQKIKKISVKMHIFMLCKEYVYMHKISRFTTYVYSTVHKNIKQLVKMDLIELQKLGRVQKISYTLKGIKLYGHLIEISKILNGGK